LAKENAQLKKAIEDSGASEAQAYRTRNVVGKAQIGDRELAARAVKKAVKDMGGSDEDAAKVTNYVKEHAPPAAIFSMGKPNPVNQAATAKKAAKDAGASDEEAEKIARVVNQVADPVKQSERAKKAIIDTGASEEIVDTVAAALKEERANMTAKMCEKAKSYVDLVRQNAISQGFGQEKADEAAAIAAQDFNLAGCGESEQVADLEENLLAAKHEAERLRKELADVQAADTGYNEGEGADYDTEEEAPVPVVNVSMTVEGVDYAILSQDTGLLSSFKAAVSKGIADESGVPESAVTMALSAGSVKATATIRIPMGVNVDTLTSKMSTSSTLGASIADSVKALPGIDAVSNGPIGASGIVASKATEAATGAFAPLPPAHTPSWDRVPPSAEWRPTQQFKQFHALKQPWGEDCDTPRCNMLRVAVATGAVFTILTLVCMLNCLVK